MSSSRGWMYNRICDGYITEEFERGVVEFLNFAFSQTNLINSDKIRCPCKKCKNLKFWNRDDITFHLYKFGFMENYKDWVDHGEVECKNPPTKQVFHTSNLNTEFVYDAMNPNFQELNLEEEPNEDAANFYKILQQADAPLWDGCQHSKVSATSQLLTVKADFNVSNACHDRYLSVMKAMLPESNSLSETTYQQKQMMKSLGLDYQIIDACVNDCILYYKEYAEENVCPVCNHPRFKPKKTIKGRRLSDVPYKRLRYLPITSRLQRLYMSRKTAEDMIWHYKNNSSDEELVSHPSDCEAWKKFDSTYPNFANDPRNVRIGICTDGFNPLSNNSIPYSVWPVLIVVYNLPPWICMKPPFIFLSLVIPGPHSPTKDIDVFLRPLIDELKYLWSNGVVTFDSYRKQIFLMRVAVMWTISDFPAYAMLSGWSTHGRMACPYCMENTKSFWLQNSGKHSWFDCHRSFLPINHEFRTQKYKFLKGKIELDCAPPMLTGEDICNRLECFEQIVFGKKSGNQKLPGFGKEHNWVKKSIFWELEYWKTNLIRHNLDVMHVEKNIFDNLFNTIMDFPNKTKDTANARRDLEKYCSRPNLHLIDGDTKKPKASYALSRQQREEVCIWLTTIRFPDGYASNIHRLVNLDDFSLYGMKTHDCHVFL